MRLSDLLHEARIAAASVADAAGDLVNPTVRLGVTGLSGAGKTVFITALVNALVQGGRLPLFRAAAEGRLAAAGLAPQPDDAVPRFAVEDHLAALVERREWPQSTRRIAELRVVLDYQPAGFWGRQLGRSRLTLDIVDYPGEWLLDLGLLEKSYAEWSAETVDASRRGARASLAAKFHAALAAASPAGQATEADAAALATAFTAYLRAARTARHALSALPPGRFLMPGDLESSPMLTFAPLDLAADAVAARGSLQAMMERRYGAYVEHVVRPFFRDHFARLDRQIVLVDVLATLNAGADAVADLEAALGDVLTAFRHGRSGWLSGLWRPEVDRLLFAATKADHLHHTSHDRLEAILARLVARARHRAEGAGAAVDVVALAAVRATREGTAERGGETLPVIVGTPAAGETVAGERYDGEEEVAIFPGDLPADPEVALRPGGYRAGMDAADADLRFVRFRPPAVAPAPDGAVRLPHIRLDRALQFLVGDKLA
ncbi:MAG TPA: YcjX family protein [Hyphomicrobiales bacterium]|nr:YcjX family protein [Hyphomicrobiales bacterium]